MTREIRKKIDLCEECYIHKAEYVYGYSGFFWNFSILLCKNCINKSEYTKLKHKFKGVEA